MIDRQQQVTTLSAPVGDSSTTAVVYGATTSASAVLVLGHGAGAGQKHPWMVRMATGIAARGVPTVTFNFLYAEHGRRAPDRTEALEGCYRAVLDAVRRELAPRALFIGGKSMGGRMATHLGAADDGKSLAGIVLLGYPLHPPGRPDQLRDAHLPRVGVPMLFVQGTRDAFGSPDELRDVFARRAIAPDLDIIEGGDHSLSVKKAGVSPTDVLDRAMDRIVEWMRVHAR